MISPRLDIDNKIVEMIDFSIGIVVKLLNGLNSLNVRITDTFVMPGNKDKRLVRTTMKSSQFHGSLRYVSRSSTKPKAMIFNMASNVKAIIKNGSEYQTILFLIEPSSGF